MISPQAYISYNSPTPGKNNDQKNNGTKKYLFLFIWYKETDFSG